MLPVRKSCMVTTETLRVPANLMTDSPLLAPSHSWIKWDNCGGTAASRSLAVACSLLASGVNHQLPNPHHVPHGAKYHHLCHHHQHPRYLHLRAMSTCQCKPHEGCISWLVSCSATPASAWLTFLCLAGHYDCRKTRLAGNRSSSTIKEMSSSWH